MRQRRLSLVYAKYFRPFSKPFSPLFRHPAIIKHNLLLPTYTHPPTTSLLSFSPSPVLLFSCSPVLFCTVPQREQRCLITALYVVVECLNNGSEFKIFLGFEFGHRLYLSVILCLRNREMEKLNFVKNGVPKLPPGFRFYPTDEELVVQYLTKKAFLCPLPASIIPEVDVCKSDPWDLPGELDKERYFFSTKEAKYPNGNRSNRATNSGYWKATGIDKRVFNSKGNQLVGMKKTLVFYRGKPPNGSRTDWIMHEYRLICAEDKKIQPSSSDQNPENWVLCRIFLKKRGGSSRSKNNEENRAMVVQSLGKNNPVFYDFMAKEDKADLNLAPALSSSDSSGITSDDHEESISCDSFSVFKRKRNYY